MEPCPIGDREEMGRAGEEEVRYSVRTQFPGGRDDANYVG